MCILYVLSSHAHTHHLMEPGTGKSLAELLFRQQWGQDEERAVCLKRQGPPAQINVYNQEGPQPKNTTL